jgi:ribosomal-protein-alanine N-acetyltransferase
MAVKRPPVTAAGPAHPPLLAAIHETAFPPDEAWNAALIAGHLCMPGVFALLAGNRAMIMARIAADEAEILTLAVAPSARRRGLGAALLQEAAARARQAGAKNLFLEVAATNDAARALYTAAGFTQVGLRRRYYEDGTDALVLARALT